ncbi:MAG: hypothetical protein Q6358_01480, partial [Candidatus Brocadiales bacterium]|nr:hypothetical protein [Candidatus Brocadiales bacterium]
KEMKREGGIDILGGSDREAANNLFDRLSEYGLFVVRRGELESWIPCLGATGHGPSWLISVFEKMGEDPATVGYLKPSTDDVWKFLADIKKWLTNARRKGIPT